MLKLSMIEKNYGTLSLDQALSLGIDFQNNGKLNEAMQVYLQILESQPDHSIAMGNLGIVYSLEGKHEAAIDCLSKETAKNPTSALAFFNLGYAELGAKKNKNAAKSFGKSLVLDPTNVDAHINLGDALNLSGEFYQAEKIYRKALEISPMNIWLHVTLGALLDSIGKFGKAKQAYENAVKIAPNDPVLYLRLATTLTDLNELEAAMVNCNRAIELNPNISESYALLARIQLKNEDNEHAIESCDTCLNLDPINTYAATYKLLALSVNGSDDLYKSYANFDLIHQHLIETPEGFKDTRQFNQALIDHITNHPKLFTFDDYEVTHYGQEVKDILEDPLGPIAHWKTFISQIIAEYIGQLTCDTGNPILDNPPENWEIMAWANVLGSEGYQESHIHGNSWISGVYYVDVPQNVIKGDNGRSGWIVFGPPNDEFPACAKVKSHWFMPEAGKAIIFPSYFYHRTVPTNSEDNRIAIAFNIVPSHP